MSRYPVIELIARAGLSAKGFFYFVVGAIAFLAAFQMVGHSSEEASNKGALKTIETLPGGGFILVALGVALLCYCVWRFTQAFHSFGKSAKETVRAAAYVFSGLFYLTLAFAAMKLSNVNGDQKQEFAAGILTKPFGEIILGLVSLVLAGTGIFQIWYGVKGKFRKHVRSSDIHSKTGRVLLRAAAIGYISRGIVWIILSYFLLTAALESDPSEAGDTGEAFRWVENRSYGSVLLALLGLGVIAYAVFNFLRARFERF